MSSSAFSTSLACMISGLQAREGIASAAGICAACIIMNEVLLLQPDRIAAFVFVHFDYLVAAGTWW